MGILEGILLGAIQGISEFLPISSSGHLALFGDIILPEPASMDLFTEVFLHLGTLGAVLIVFAREAFPVFLSPFTAIPKFCGGGLAAARAHAPLRLLGLVFLASIPAACVGLLFEESVEALTKSPGIVALLLGCTGLILLAAEYSVRRRERTAPNAALNTMETESAPAAPSRLVSLGGRPVRNALGIGLAQAAAIFPGLSRSGLTISAARLLGCTREDAGVFSFLLFVPAIAGAALLQILKIISAAGGSAGGSDAFANGPAGDIIAQTAAAHSGASLFVPAYHIAGLLSSFVFGLLALTLLVRLLKAGRFHVFGWYCLAASLFWFVVL